MTVFEQECSKMYSCPHARAWCGLTQEFFSWVLATISWSALLLLPQLRAVSFPTKLLATCWSGRTRALLNTSTSILAFGSKNKTELTGLQACFSSFNALTRKTCIYSLPLHAFKSFSFHFEVLNVRIRFWIPLLSYITPYRDSFLGPGVDPVHNCNGAFSAWTPLGEPATYVGAPVSPATHAMQLWTRVSFKPFRKDSNTSMDYSQFFFANAPFFCCYVAVCKQ